MIVLAKLNNTLTFVVCISRGGVGKSQGDKLKSSVAVLCVVSRFPGSLMFMQGIECNRGKLFWFSGLIKKALPFLLLKM